MKKINLSQPSINFKEINAVIEVLKSGWLIRGKQTLAFEQEFAKYMGAKYAVSTNGCTMALFLAVKQMKLKKTDEVLVPSLTWSATASIVIQAGATPVFVDVDKKTFCMDPKDALTKITKNTKLVIPVHFAGKFAKGFENFPVPVLYDSAHRIIENGFDGTTSCYSFYAVKNMTTVRGGMILTNDKEKAKWYAMASHGGLSKDTLSRYQGTGNKIDVSNFYYEVVEPGWNFDMTDVEAAIGREQLKKVNRLTQKREKIVNKYNKAFRLNNGGTHLYPILLQNRDEFMVKMKQAGIQCSIHYLPLHLMSGYKKFYKEHLPVTEFIGQRIVSIPLYPDLSEKDINYIIEKVLEFAKFERKNS